MAATSPCIAVCRIDALSGLCLGCRRSREEIAAWPSLSESERQRIAPHLPAR